MKTLLQARRISVLAGGKKVCRELDLTVEKGEAWAILGVNGIGKTSLMHALCGIRKIPEGEVRLKGIPIQEMRKRDIARIAGILFQDSEDPFPSTVFETALIGRHPHIPSWGRESPEDEKIALDAIRTVGLSGMEHRLSDTLSGGERRRLALATLLAQDPELYFLDEPTNHLDIRHQIEMLDLLTTRTKDSGKATFMILHDPNLAERYCDRILLILEDGLVLQGRKAEILNESNLSRLYRYPIRSISGEFGRIFVPA